jgi:galactose mutarotase-like enzyme
MLDGGGFPWTFGEEPGGIFCVEAPATEDGFAEIQLGPIAAVGGKTLRVRFRADTLPYLQIWRNQKAPADIVGIEPVSHRWVLRHELEAAGEFNLLKPGESRSYGLRFAFV